MPMLIKKLQSANIQTYIIDYVKDELERAKARGEAETIKEIMTAINLRSSADMKLSYMDVYRVLMELETFKKVVKVKVGKQFYFYIK